MREGIDVGTDAYTQEELLTAIRGLEEEFSVLYVYASKEDWAAYRMRMRLIDLHYRQLRSQGPALGVAATRP